MPNILKMAMKIDCPLSEFLRLKNITTNSTEISKFCLNAAYTPSTSPRYNPPDNIMLNAVTIEIAKTVLNIGEDKLENSFL